MSGGKFNFGQIGQGRSALPVEKTQKLPATPEPAPVATKPKAKAKKQTPKPIAGGIKNREFIVRFTAEEHNRILEWLDGRPASTKLREVILNELFG